MHGRRFTIIHFVCTLIQRTFDYLFILYWLCWFIIRYTRINGTPIPFLNNWLTDFVFIPIIVHPSLVLSTALLKPDKPGGYALTAIFAVCLVVSLVYEWLLPLFAYQTRADVFDVIAYFFGGLFYYLVHQQIYLVRLKRSRNGDCKPKDGATVAA